MYSFCPLPFARIDEYGCSTRWYWWLAVSLLWFAQHQHHCTQYNTLGIYLNIYIKQYTAYADTAYYKIYTRIAYIDRYEYVMLPLPLHAVCHTIYHGQRGAHVHHMICYTCWMDGWLGPFGSVVARSRAAVCLSLLLGTGTTFHTTSRSALVGIRYRRSEVSRTAFRGPH